MSKLFPKALFFIKSKINTNPFVLISIFSQIFVLIISIFTWKYLSINDFGILSILEFYSLICVSIFGISSEQLIVRDYFKWTDRVKKYYVGNVLLINWGSSILLFSIIACLSYSLPVFNIPYDLIFLNLLGALLQSTSLVPFSLIRFRSNVKEYIIYMFFSSVFRAIVSYIFVATFNQGIYGLLIAQVYSGIALLIGNVIYLLPKTKFVISKRIFNEIRKFCFPLIPSTLLANFSSVVFRFILGKYSTLEINGYYNIANKLSSPITSLHTALKVTYVPGIVSLDSQNLEKNKEKIANLSKKYFNILFLVTLLIVLFLTEIVNFLLPSIDLASVKIISIFIVIIFITTCQLYFSFGIFLSRKTKYQFLPNLFNVLLLFFPGIYLIIKYDTLGIYFEEILRVLVSSAMAYFLSVKFYKLKSNILYFLIVILLVMLVSQVNLSLYNKNYPFLMILIKSALFIYTTYLFINKKFI